MNTTGPGYPTKMLGIKWPWVAVLAGLCIFFPIREIRDPSWFSISGQDWANLSPDARNTFLSGFLAGSALSQALASGVRDSAGLWRVMDSLRVNGLVFRYAANVYGARLDDYYWWQNHRPNALWYAFWEVNNDLKRQMQQEE